jgi:hypothetical protein
MREFPARRGESREAAAGSCPFHAASLSYAPCGTGGRSGGRPPISGSWSADPEEHGEAATAREED